MWEEQEKEVKKGALKGTAVFLTFHLLVVLIYGDMPFSHTLQEISTDGLYTVFPQIFFCCFMEDFMLYF